MGTSLSDLSELIVDESAEIVTRHGKSEPTFGGYFASDWQKLFLRIGEATERIRHQTQVPAKVNLGSKNVDYLKRAVRHASSYLKMRSQGWYVGTTVKDGELYVYVRPYEPRE